jgi:hypothetical protein
MAVAKKRTKTSMATKICYHRLTGWWHFNSKTQDVAMNPMGLIPENDCPGEAIVKYRLAAILIRTGTPYQQTCN